MRFPKVNKDLVPFKLHYFLKHGGASFISFVAPLANQRGISSEGVGVIWTVSPLVCALSNMATGALADAKKLHKTLLMVSTALFAVSLMTFFFLPAIPLSQQRVEGTSNFTVCANNGNILIICPNDVNTEFATDERTLVCNNNNNTYQSGPIPPGDDCDLNCSYGVVVANQSKLQETTEHFLLTRQNVGNDDRCFMASYDNVNRTFLTNRILLQCENTCENINYSENILLADFLTIPQFWLNGLFVIVMSVGLDISFTLANTLCLAALGEDRHKYGQTRLFGPLGWGIMGAVSGGLVNFFSKGQDEVDYTPAMVITSSFLLATLMVTSRINVVVPGRQTKGEIGRVLLSFPCISLLVTSLIFGTIMGLIWTFEFIYLKDVALNWDPNFSDLNLLQGLIVWTDNFGEVPFMFLSAYIIERLSHIHTLTLTLVTATIRLLLYSLITNPWLFLPVHLLNGISFGVFLTTLASYADFLAPSGAQATLQSVASAFFVVGSSLGAFVGGILLDTLGGAQTYFIMGLFVTFYTILYIVINRVYGRCCGSVILGNNERGQYSHPDEENRTKDTEYANEEIYA